MSTAFSQRHILIGIVLTFVVVAIWGVFLKDYALVGTTEDAQRPVSSAESDANATDFEYFSKSGQVPEKNSRIIAEQNMFSSARREWVAPQTRDDVASPGKGKAGLAEKSRQDIELRGVAVVAGEPRVILRFMSFKPEETKLLKEGDYVSVPGGSGKAYLIVDKIGSESVVLRDQDGVEHAISLREHRRTIVPSSPAEVTVIVNAATVSAAAEKPVSKGAVSSGKASTKSVTPVKRQKSLPKKTQ